MVTWPMYAYISSVLWLLRNDPCIGPDVYLLIYMPVCSRITCVPVQFMNLIEDRKRRYVV